MPSAVIRPTAVVVTVVVIPHVFLDHLPVHVVGHVSGCNSIHVICHVFSLTVLGVIGVHGTRVHFGSGDADCSDERDDHCKRHHQLNRSGCHDVSPRVVPRLRTGYGYGCEHAQETPLERFWAILIVSPCRDRLSVLNSGVLLRGNGSIPFPAQIVRRIHPVRSSLRLSVQQPPFFELRHGLADLTFGELRSIPQFDLCQSW